MGRLDYVTDLISGYTKAIDYDSYSRPSKTVTSLGVGGADGDHYEKATYDQYGRTFQVFDAARTSDTYTDNGLETRYNAYGYAYQLVDAVYVNGQPRRTYQETLAMDARGNVTSEKLSKSVVTSRAYDSKTGRLSTLVSTKTTGTYGDVQELSYQWDTLGNLTWRKDLSGSKNLTENFTYDGLNRLTASTGAGITDQFMTYDSLGNIKSKTGVGSYTYGSSVRPHAVTNAGGVTYAYDNNGNNTSSSDGRSISYTVFNKASNITKGGHTTTFAYGPERSRYKRVDTSAGKTQTTLYIGSVEKITESDGSKKVKRYIGGLAIETEDYASNGSLTTQTTQLIFKDHLGSTDVITNDLGTIASNGEFSFDAWGQRRSGVNWTNMTTAQLLADFGVFSVNTPATTRGYTGHEMVDEVGIIHMNGRIYDARLGRFLQADSIIDGATNTQGFNRYSYVHNNPLNATDPTGNFSLRKWVGAIVAIVGTVICGGNAQCGMAGYAAVGAASGAAGAAANGGNILQGAIMGGISAAAFYAVGTYFSDMAAANAQSYAGFDSWAKSVGVKLSPAGLTSGQMVAKIAAHGLVGGVMSVMQGGKFGHGFASAGITQSFAKVIGGLDKGTQGFSVLRTVAAGIVGGTASALTGGKFANGAMTGAFSRAFNDDANGHAQKGQSRGCSGQMCRQQLYEQDSKLFQSADLSVDGQLCAGPCIGGELELSKDHGTSTTIKSGFGLKASGGGGSDINIINLGEMPQNGDLSTINYLSGQLGPAGITINHYAWPEGSQWSFELNLRFPGGLGVNGGTGLKKW